MPARRMPRPARKASEPGKSTGRRSEATGLEHTRFRMESRRTAVAPAVERVIAASRPAGLTQEQTDNLAVAVAEALSNAAVHGNRLEPGSQVRVKIAVERGSCVIVDISDTGPGFDLTAVSDPTHPERVLATGGRGVFLMRRLVDEVEFNKAGNRVRLTVRVRRRRTSPRRRAADR